MDIRNIKTFIRVAELKSFSKAAKELSYVQSTVTMQIKHLEKELGYSLFDRIGKTVSLTQPGAEFLLYAYEMLHVLHKAENLSKNAVHLGGTLRVGVLESLLSGPLQELLPKFKDRHKNISLKIKTGETNELLRQLKQNVLDMVYITSGINTDPDLICCCKREENLLFLCDSNHVLADKKNVTAQEIFKYHFAVTEHSGFCYRRLIELAAQYNAKLYESVELNSTSVITNLAHKGMGIAFLPEYAVKHHLENHFLVKIDTLIPKQIYFSQVLYHKNRWLSPYMKDFIEMLEQN